MQWVLGASYELNASQQRTFCFFSFVLFSLWTKCLWKLNQNPAWKGDVRFAAFPSHFFVYEVLSLVSIKPITSTTTTNFESKQSDEWLLNLVIALFLCGGRGICRVMETRPKGANFAWACLITLSNRFYKNFFPKRSFSPGKRQNWILLFSTSGRTSTHIENIIPIWSRGSMAHCFNLLRNVRYRITERTAPNRWQRFESSCNQSVFNFFSIGSACSRSLFSFANILLFYVAYFIWFNFTLKFFQYLCSTFYNENQAEIIYE